jgi:hypothetical protein
MHGANSLLMTLLTKIAPITVSLPTERAMLKSFPDMKYPLQHLGNFAMSALDNLNALTVRVYGNKAHTKDIINMVVYHTNDDRIANLIANCPDQNKWRTLQIDQNAFLELTPKQTDAWNHFMSRMVKFSAAMIDKVAEMENKPKTAASQAPSAMVDLQDDDNDIVVDDVEEVEDSQETQSEKLKRFTCSNEKAEVHLNNKRQKRNFQSVPVITELGSVASLKVPEGASVADLKRALSDRYKSTGLKPDHISLQKLDGVVIADDQKVNALGCDIQMQTIFNSLRIRLLQYDQPDNSGHKVHVEYLRPVIGSSQDPAVIADALRQILKAADVGEGKTRPWIIVFGDQQTYKIMVDLIEENTEFDRVLPWIGEFHLMWHTNGVVIDRYWEFCLKNFAKLVPNQSDAFLDHLKRNAKFDDSVCFLQQSWEAALQAVLLKFREWCATKNIAVPDADQLLASNAFDQFQKACEVNATMQLFLRFTLLDGAASNALYFAVRTGNWDLRGAAMKKFAFNWFITNKHNYQKLFYTNMRHEQVFPLNAILALQHHFVITWTDSQSALLAGDEGLEKTVNRDTKPLLMASTLENFQEAMRTLPHQRELFNNLISQTEGDDTAKAYLKPKHLTQGDVRTMTTAAQKIIDMRKDDVVRNVFNGKVATPQAQRDLKEAVEIGKQRMQLEVNSEIFGVEQPVANMLPAILQKRPAKLLVFGDKPSTQNKTKKLLEESKRDRQVLVEALKRKEADIGTPISTIMKDVHNELVGFPTALVDACGDGRKPAKSVFLAVTCSRFENAAVVDKRQTG